MPRGSPPLRNAKPSPGDEVEGPLRQAGGASVSGYDFDVLKAALREEGLSERDRVRADLDADHSSRRAHPRGEQIEAAAWTAADLQDAGAVRYSDLIEQAGRLMSELLGLALQTFLFRVACSRGRSDRLQPCLSLRYLSCSPQSFPMTSLAAANVTQVARTPNPGRSPANSRLAYLLRRVCGWMAPGTVPKPLTAVIVVGLTGFEPATT